MGHTKRPRKAALECGQPVVTPDGVGVIHKLTKDRAEVVLFRLRGGVPCHRRRKYNKKLLVPVTRAMKALYQDILERERLYANRQ